MTANSLTLKKIFVCIWQYLALFEAIFGINLQRACSTVGTCIDKSVESESTFFSS